MCPPENCESDQANKDKDANQVRPHVDSLIVDHKERPEDPPSRVEVDAVPIEDVIVVMAVCRNIFDATNVRYVII